MNEKWYIATCATVERPVLVCEDCVKLGIPANFTVLGLIDDNIDPEGYGDKCYLCNKEYEWRNSVEQVCNEAVVAEALVAAEREFYRIVEDKHGFDGAYFEYNAEGYLLSVEFERMTKIAVERGM